MPLHIGHVLTPSENFIFLVLATNDATGAQSNCLWTAARLAAREADSGSLGQNAPADSQRAGPSLGRSKLHRAVKDQTRSFRHRPGALGFQWLSDRKSTRLNSS